MMIRKLRLQKAWSQEQLAEFSGLSIRTVQRVEQGHAASLETLKSLAAVFEVNVNHLQLQAEPAMTDVSTASRLPNPTLQAQLPLDEQQAFYQVKKIRGFYNHVLRYALIISLLVVVNALTSTRYWWVFWPMVGWGIGLAAHGTAAFGLITVFGPEWEKRQVEKRLGRKL